jgi:hypothetical protein
MDLELNEIMPKELVVDAPIVKKEATRVDSTHPSQWDPSAEDIMYVRPLTSGELAYFQKKKLMETIADVIKVLIASLPGILAVIKTLIG